MKFTVEINEFWMNEDESFDDVLKRDIIRDVLSQIRNSLKPKIDDEIKRLAKNEFEKEMTLKIRGIIEETIKTEKVKGYRGGEEITIKEHIVDMFKENTTARFNPAESIKKISKEFISELKERYDFMFASSVVQKMAENGMLKDTNIAKLFNDKKEK